MKYAVYLAALCLSACASTGINISEQQVQGFQKGVSTYADVVGRLGNPTSSVTMADGTRVAIYSYGHYQTRAASFIPVVGMFAGGGDLSGSAVSFTFDANGTLKDWSRTGFGQGVVTGVAAGTKPSIPVKN